MEKYNLPHFAYFCIFFAANKWIKIIREVLAWLHATAQASSRYGHVKITLQTNQAGVACEPAAGSARFFQ